MLARKVFIFGGIKTPYGVFHDGCLHRANAYVQCRRDSLVIPARPAYAARLPVAALAGIFQQGMRPGEIREDSTGMDEDHGSVSPQAPVVNTIQ